MPASERYTLHHCALSDAPLAAESVDVIVTDPPYGRESLPSFSELVTLAARVLKPGGSLLVMSGQCYLPEVMSRLTTDDLNWQWELALICRGQATRIFPRNVTPMWKPVLWYVKGKYQGDCVVDVITSDQNDKRFHQWGQSESGMAALVERFSLPGQTILDPFVGGGTTGVVALKLGRRFIGIDRDQSAIEMTKARLSA
jgi:tRNA G10  N-methylase Trm11